MMSGRRKRNEGMEEGMKLGCLIGRVKKERSWGVVGGREQKEERKVGCGGCGCRKGRVWGSVWGRQEVSWIIWHRIAKKEKIHLVHGGGEILHGFSTGTIGIQKYVTAIPNGAEIERDWCFVTESNVSEVLCKPTSQTISCLANVKGRAERVRSGITFCCEVTAMQS